MKNYNYIYIAGAVILSLSTIAIAVYIAFTPMPEHILTPSKEQDLSNYTLLLHCDLVTVDTPGHDGINCYKKK